MSVIAFGLFGAVVFVGSGFLPRLWESSDDSAPLASENFIFGYACTAVSCFFSLVVFGDMLYGATLIAVASFAAVVQAVRNGWKPFQSATFSPAVLVKILFLVFVFLVYRHLLFGLDDQYALPSVYDLPKHLSAIASASAATGWPMPNPWLPDEPFAYNLLFYTPLGFLVRLGGPKCCSPVFAAALLFVTWHALGLFQSIMTRLNIPRDRQVVGLLFATFACGYGPLILFVDAPLTFQLSHALSFGESHGRYFEDAATNFIFLPQHIFAVLCVLCTWLFAVRDAAGIPGLAKQLTLSVAAALTSYLVAPLAGVAFGGLLLLQTLSGRQSLVRVGGVLLAASILVLPFILQAKRWEGTHIQTVPWKSWFIVPLLTAGPVLICAVLAFWKRPQKSEHYVVWSYRGLALCIGVLWVLVAPRGEFSMKWSIALWFCLIPLACQGFFTALEKARWALREGAPIAGAAVLGYLCLHGVTLFAVYLSSSNQKHAPDQARMLRVLRDLPPDVPVWIEKSDQALAAQLGRVVTMNFQRYRRGAYLPLDRREVLNKWFPTEASSAKTQWDRLEMIRSTGSVAVFPRDEWNKVILMLNPPVLAETSGHVVVDLRPVTAEAIQHARTAAKLPGERILDGHNFHWVGQTPPPPSCQVAAELPRISCSQFADCWCSAPLQLAPGLYRITASVSGQVEGTGHVSLLGNSKLIVLPAGKYPTPTRFDNLFNVGSSGFEGQVAFGLGGWSVGRGNLELHGLVIERVQKPAGLGVKP